MFLTVIIMRIRKNAKLSSLLYSHGGSAPLETTFHTHVCQLNQSPWDVIPFGSDSNQLEAEDSFAGNNVSHGDSLGAVESVASMMDIDQRQTMPKIEAMLVEDKHTLPPPPPYFSRDKGDKHSKSFSCQKTDGKGWHCKNEAKPGQSVCDHHYSMLKSYGNNNNSGNSCQSKKSTPPAATVRRACARAASKKSSSNPYEFYYYSGFGPSWGKRRGDRNERNDSKIDEERTAEGASDNDAVVDDDGIRASAVTVNANGARNSNGRGSSSSNPSSSSQIHNDDEFNDYVDDDEHEGNNGDSSGKNKRMRKPVKARSLKSLM